MSVPSTGGNLENSHLQEIQLRADAMVGSQLRNADYIAETATAQKVIASQTANVALLQDPQKDKEVSILWVNQCTDTLADMGSECTLDGQEATSSKETYELTLHKKTTFKAKRLAFRSQFFDQPDVVVVGLAKALKEMDEFWNEQVVATIAANSGTNVVTSPYTVAGSTTTIPPSAWNASLMGYFAKVILKNKIRGSYLLTADNLFNAMWNAAYDAANADGKGAMGKFGSIETVFDMFGLAAASVDSNSYLVHPDSVALVTKSYFPGVTPNNPAIIPAMSGQQSRWSVASPTIPGVTYDVHYAVDCTGGEFYDIWNIVSKGDVIVNPTACTTGRTGILEFECA
jgi:hypothetical protein